MDITSVIMVYFSPTGTSKAVAEGIARGIGRPETVFIDITSPGARKESLSVSEHELLVIAVPVYMGRVPALLNEWMRVLRAEGSPAACVVVCGNRAYENALLELTDRVAGCGGIPIAGASFIGEHSFSSADLPTAEGRPDQHDVCIAESFGRKIIDKLKSASELTAVEVPGTSPYGGMTKLWDVDFISVNDQCVQCGLCAEVCPVGAVDSENSRGVDLEMCITCCACIKTCPQHARGMKPGPVNDAAVRLNSLCKEPMQPEFFL
ncbi:(Fe-S)-binding protein [Desulfoluna limicola]|uniref:(Fe-S)-binding protein n=1 Tax=Desulfoluna limicola TaxID=2810562 RepID=A0ABM7PCX4_9BACT|nr:EFR1 family ferrodoxin [Desulfoluna limicola]BCS95378.1 (Fe-S)-binding protein [Desulfoluna limicola]